MKKQSFLFGAVLVSAALALASCNQAAPEGATDALSAVSIGAFRDATVTTEGSTITATRSGEGNQGVTLRRSAVLVHFTVEGQNPRIRITRGNQSMQTRAAADNAVMIGPGGATSVSVFSSTGDTLKVNVTSVVDCGTAPEGACQPPQFPASSEGGEEGDEAGATTAPAPAPAATTP
ncbi:MAG: hypothetical protein NW206_10395 [Hyphomonadaceae bacterium]|nr:hypothetical protein [Hyphomonadaceae bacterium]